MHCCYLFGLVSACSGSAEGEGLGTCKFMQEDAKEIGRISAIVRY